MTLEAVIWDFGGVFTTSPFEAFARYEAEKGLPKDLIRTINATNHLENAWAKFERAEVTHAQFDELFAAEARALAADLAPHGIHYVEAPARGFHWGMATFHPTLPRGARVKTTTRGTLQEILLGPAHENDGRMNLFGALRTAMATCGYQTVKEFQKAEVMVAPALQTEGKDLQRSQGVGMGH